MTTDTLDIPSLIATIAALLAIVGAVWKGRGYVDRITHQLEHNSHRSDPPTMRDEVDSARVAAEQARRETRALRSQLNRHVSASEHTHDRIWHAINGGNSEDH